MISDDLVQHSAASSVSRTGRGYLHLLFSAEALGDGGTFDQILASSADFAADLASRLRDRVYREAVPALARAIAARLDPNPDEAQLAARRGVKSQQSGGFPLLT